MGLATLLRDAAAPNEKRATERSLLGRPVRLLRQDDAAAGYLCQFLRAEGGHLLSPLEVGLQQRNLPRIESGAD